MVPRMHSDHDQNDPTRFYPGAPVAASSGRSPWIAAGAVSVVAAVIVGVLIASSGGSGTNPLGASPGRPTLPGDLPGLSTGLPTTTSTKPPTDTGVPSRSGTATSPTTTKSTAPTNDWNTASADKKPFTTREWFPETGPLTIQGRPYNQLAQDKSTCSAAESGLRSMFGSDCLGIIRSLWTNSAKTHVASLSVISLTDKLAAQSIANRLSAGQSNGQYVAFIQPPSKSGVTFSEQYRTWVGSMPSGHYLVIVEVARSGGSAPDSAAKTVYDDLFLIAQQHINAVTIWGG